MADDLRFAAAVVGEHVAAHDDVEGVGRQAGVVGVAHVGRRVRELEDGALGEVHGTRVPVDAHGGPGETDVFGQHRQHGAWAAADIGDGRARRDAGCRPVVGFLGRRHLGHQPVAARFFLAQCEGVVRLRRHGEHYAGRPARGSDVFRRAPRACQHPR
jgi:hypothetical protein